MTEQPTIEWSATLNVASPTSYPSKDLDGDKIILPQSALEQLLAASTSCSNPASISTPASSNPFRNPHMPTSASSSSRAPYAFDGDPYQQLPSPLMFRLVNPLNGNAVYAGIREFSAEEGEVLLSSYLIEALGFDSAEDAPNQEDAPSNKEAPTPQITIHAKHLPKGAYVRLRPLEAGYNPDDWKSLLERKLRESFTTLTNGAILSVPGVKGELFRLLIDGFRPEGDGICVVNTDLEVDIEALDEAQARETMRQIIARQQKAPGTTAGSSVGQELNIWKAVDGQVLPGDYVDYELPSWARSRVLEIDISELRDEYGVDLFVSPKSSRQRAAPRQSEYIFGAFSYAEDGAGSKRIIIQPTNVELENAESLLISVFGYIPNSSVSPTDASPLPYRLRVKNNAMTTETPTVTGSAIPEVQEEVHPDEETCTNCLQRIPKRTIILHENFCLRNNVACPRCRNVFQKASDEWREHWHCPHDEVYGSSSMTKAKHDDIYHTERRCPSCPFSTNSIPDLARHRTTLCPGKIILCQFCHLEVCQEGDPFNPSAEMLHTGLTEHELVDGARTTDCHLCSKIIRLRDMSTHLKYHELEKAHRPKPPICRNANCGRTLHGVGRNGAVNAGTKMGQGPGNDIGLCSLCFSPLYVSLYDPEGKALKRRIERRYLTQMMQGCGKRWCANEWCKTGRANLKLEPKPSTTQLVLPQIRPLMDSVRDTQKSMYFCVDEANQRRRMLAGMLAAEDDWDLEWCIAACEAEGPDLDRARGWLINWAPSNE
ncbi:ubiquitin fusion degradation protein UFD1-domain-containing protein [Rostrohypoxylon terebratum]|nr:ubiquitin fusion degradation protein UFD1-domain-containing protein [Rostrohypoxylon terebratum]